MNPQLVVPGIDPRARSPWLRDVRADVPEAINGILQYREAVLFDGHSCEMLKDAIRSDSFSEARKAVSKILSWDIPTKKKHLMIVARALVDIYDGGGR